MFWLCVEGVGDGRMGRCQVGWSGGRRPCGGRGGDAAGLSMRTGGGAEELAVLTMIEKWLDRGVAWLGLDAKVTAGDYVRLGIMLGFLVLCATVPDVAKALAYGVIGAAGLMIIRQCVEAARERRRGR